MTRSPAIFAICLLAAGCSSSGGPTDLLGQNTGNPNGPAPAFTVGDVKTDAVFVTVEELKKEFDRGANILILDVRPANDYNVSHIKGAVHYPFYTAAEQSDRLPRNRWLVAYCACPNSESRHTVWELSKKGFELLKVIKEGFDGWVNKGYPLDGPGPQKDAGAAKDVGGKDS